MTPDQQPPLGYLLKALDQALSAYTDDALKPHRLTRLHWQTLNAIRNGKGQTFEQILGTLGQFADKVRLQAVIDELATRHWLQLVGPTYSLTPTGDDGLRVAGETQGKVRDQLTRGLSRGDYDAVIATLQKMLTNVSIPASGR
jgi:hypothetical protein